MDEELEVVRPACKVRVGDYFYKKPLPGNKPDRIRVTNVERGKTGLIITGKYISHVDGPSERKFSSIIFNSDQYVIEHS